MKLPEIKVIIKMTKGDKVYKVNSSETTFMLFRSLFSDTEIIWREHFILLCLNRANEVIGYFRISSGGMAGTVADPKVIFQISLGCNASGIIICHNHPSGNTKPSMEDIRLTKKINDGAKLLDIKMLDHIIITDNKYYSFADEGEL